MDVCTCIFLNLVYKICVDCTLPDSQSFGFYLSSPSPFDYRRIESVSLPIKRNVYSDFPGLKRESVVVGVFT